MQVSINVDLYIFVYKFAVLFLLTTDLHNGFKHINIFCRFPCFRTALLLVHAGANVTATDSQRNTPLHTLVSTVSTLVMLSRIFLYLFFY